jgi:hypothetical protein
MASRQQDAHVDDHLQMLDLVLLQEEEAAIEASIAAANHAVDSYPVGSHEWEEAATFLREIEEQDKQQQQEESCNRWL